jgi:AcrR family transcriptional regulator
LPKTIAHPSPSSTAPTRERIKAVAEDLYVLRGHDRFSFGDIAEVIGTTRANIHHHFGNKQRLMTELIEGFAADAQSRIELHWTKPGLTLPERLNLQLDDLRRFYKRFNPRRGDRNVWSPISRLRLDLPVLGAAAIEALDRINHVYDDCLRRALTDAVASGELAENTPIGDLAGMLRVTLLSCPPMTQDTGDFAEIENLFAALDRTIISAWSRPVRTGKPSRTRRKA